MTGPTNNPIALSNLYPGAPGATVAQAGSENNPGATNTMDSSVAVHPVEMNFMRSLGDNPLWTWLAFALALGILMYVVTRIRGASGANLKFTLYNIIVVTGMTILGGSIAKVIATRWRLPFGISTIINAS